MADDLNTQYSGGFGSFNIHRLLTLAQLDELLKLKPDLIQNANFAQAWISKLQPGDDEDWRRDPALTKAYLDRLVAFTRKLPPSFNPLKAHVLFHRLVLDQSLGIVNKALFIEYLQLPRFQGYMSKVMLENNNQRQFAADLNGQYTPWTMLSVVGNDETLVRSYLKELLLKAENAKEYEPYINDVYLQHLFAETKIENGLGEPETWAAQLPPEQYRQLKDRIDIDFAATNKTAFGVDEPVKSGPVHQECADVDGQSVRSQHAEFLPHCRSGKWTPPSISMAWSPIRSNTHTYTDAPFRRIGRTFDFPQMTKPGVYVVDFIGARQEQPGADSQRPSPRCGRHEHRRAEIDDHR